MKYECPSCHLLTEDDVHPLNFVSHPLCVFCSTKHTQKELLNWQMDHLENIAQKHVHKIIRHLYKYFENEIKTIQVDIANYREKQNSDCGASVPVSSKE